MDFLLCSSNVALFLCNVAGRTIEIDFFSGLPSPSFVNGRDGPEQGLFRVCMFPCPLSKLQEVCEPIASHATLFAGDRKGFHHRKDDYWTTSRIAESHSLHGILTVALHDIAAFTSADVEKLSAQALTDLPACMYQCCLDFEDSLLACNSLYGRRLNNAIWITMTASLI